MKTLCHFHYLLTPGHCPPQESVLANLKSLDTLLSWVQKRKGGREVVRQAIEALQELMLTVLLPGRKLKFLEQQPIQVCAEGIAQSIQLQEKQMRGGIQSQEKQTRVGSRWPT